MLKQLAMLLKLRAWLKSDGLKAGGIVGVLAAIQTWVSSQQGIDLLAMLAGYLHLSSGTLTGLVGGLTGVAMLVLRAKAEWSLSEVASGADKATPPAATP